MIAGAVTKFAQTSFQCIKNFAEHLFLRITDQAIECRKSSSHIVNSKAISLIQPCREKIIIGDKIAKVLLTIINKFLVVLMYMFLKVSFFISVLF